MGTEIAVVTGAQMELASAFMPVMAMPQAIQRYNAVLEFTKQIMREGKDFGKIPGVEKPSLFKPGAEKLCNFFGLTPKFVVVKETEQWDGDEPFFYYWYKCQLWRGSILIAEGDGSCNSRESKYRYRWVAADQIPQHLNREKLPFRAGKATEPEFAIERGETSGKYGKPSEYWQAFRDAIASGAAVAGKKESSTGKQMKTWSIESTVYRIPNPDISDVVNTIQKMSQKRALVAVTLIGCNASEYYTQDIEDMQSIDVPYSVIREDAAKIDTGGHPVGTQAAADHVAQTKTRAAQQRRPQEAPPQFEEPPMDDAPPEYRQRKEDIPMLDRTIATFTNAAAITAAFAELRTAWGKVLDVRDFDQILAENNMAEGQARTLRSAKAAFRAAWMTLEKATAEMQPEQEPAQ